MSDRSPSANLVLLSIKAVITIGLGWLIISQVRIAEVWAVLAAAKLPLLGASFALLLARLPLAGYRWRLLLDRQGHRFSTGYLTRLIFVSHFFATLLPGASGVDLMRGYYLYRRGVEPHQVFSTVVADRSAGIASMVLLTLSPAIWVAWARPDLWPIPVTVLTLSGLAISGGALLPRLQHNKWQDASGLACLLGTVASELAGVLADRRLVRRLISLSLWFQLVGILAAYLVGRAVDAEVGLIYYVMFMPLIWLWTTLPISINGIGVREGTFLFYFGLIGIPAETALAMALLIFAQSLLQGLLGGVLLLLDHPRASIAPETREGPT